MTAGSVGFALSADAVQTLLGHLEGSEIEELDLHWQSIHLRLLLDPVLASRAQEPPEGDSVWAGTLAVTAPLTGVFYARPSPDQDSWVMVGSVVHPGQIVGLIETMKLFNEVACEVQGRIVAIEAVDGDLVETGQTLMRVDTSERTG